LLKLRLNYTGFPVKGGLQIENCIRKRVQKIADLEKSYTGKSKKNYVTRYDLKRMDEYINSYGRVKAEVDKQLLTGSLKVGRFHKGKKQCN